MIGFQKDYMEMIKSEEHKPVLLKEVIKNLQTKKKAQYIDATLGFGGHSVEILKSGGQVLGIEWDPEVAILAKKRLKTFCPGASWQVVCDNFANIKEIAERNEFSRVMGILFDLGISRWHYKKAGRGFSFIDSKLDMRINPRLKLSAEEVINNFSNDQFYVAFSKLVQEELGFPIAQALVRARRLKKISSAKELAGIVKEVYQEKRKRTRLDPATKVFLAIRIIVNNELANLEKGLEGAFEILRANGKLLVITFNSTEDRIVKKFFKSKKNQGVAVKDKVIFPSVKEVGNNPLSRSAKLRILKKV